MADTFDDVATGLSREQPLLEIFRIHQGSYQRFVLLEEPIDPVWKHYDRTSRSPVLHYKVDCKHCGVEGVERQKPFWYIGAGSGKRWGIVELTMPCFRSIEYGAKSILTAEQEIEAEYSDGAITGATFRGLLIEIRRADFDKSPRVARVIQRLTCELPEWTFDTRRELARIWNIPVKPRIFKEA